MFQSHNSVLQLQKIKNVQLYEHCKKNSTERRELQIFTKNSSQTDLLVNKSTTTIHG